MPIYQDGPASFTDVPAGGSARLRDDLRRLTRPDPAPPAMPQARQPKAIPAGLALGAGPGARPAGIASPLTEEDYATREWHAAQVYSSDGFLSWPQIKKQVFKDANGATVEIVFKPKP